MSMHLEGPWLTTTGKRQGKQKFRSAEHKRQAEELAQSEAELMKRWGVHKPSDPKTFRTVKVPGVVTTVYRRGQDQPRIPSLDTGHTGAVASRERQVYTGNKILGIGTLHKSNAVPVFSEDEAQDMARMRR